MNMKQAMDRRIEILEIEKELKEEKAELRDIMDALFRQGDVEYDSKRVVTLSKAFRKCRKINNPTAREIIRIAGFGDIIHPAMDMAVFKDLPEEVREEIEEVAPIYWTEGYFKLKLKKTPKKKYRRRKY